MKNPGFFFSLFVGIITTIIGALLSTLGPAGWNLAVVGILIIALSIWQRVDTLSSQQAQTLKHKHQPSPVVN